MLKIKSGGFRRKRPGKLRAKRRHMVLNKKEVAFMTESNTSEILFTMYSIFPRNKSVGNALR